MWWWGSAAASSASSSLRVRGSGVSLLAAASCSRRCWAPGDGWGWPVGERVVSVVDAGEFGVFDDVGPVFEDPVAAGVLGGGGVEEGRWMSAGGS